MNLNENVLNDHGFDSIKPMVYNNTDKFGNIMKLFHFKKTAKKEYMSPTQLAFYKSKLMFQKDFNITNIL